jgi:RNA 2',3'-cyclic 3'-phosphodiesterase
MTGYDKRCRVPAESFLELEMRNSEAEEELAMPRLRTFIALDLGKPIRDRLVGLQEKLAADTSEVKWVEPDNLHVTLLFLGEVDQREIIDVCRAVERVAAELPAYPLTVGGVGCFPNARRPRILWAGVSAGAAETVTLHDALEQPLLELGCYRREQRKFTPHVTLGRIRGERSVDGLDKVIAKHEAWHVGETTIAEVHVMSSELTRDGPKYTVLSRAPLG